MRPKNKNRSAVVEIGNEHRLHVLVVGAHPDDNTFISGGTSALFAEMGHEVKYITLTNGDAGHFKKSGVELARIRREESFEARDRLGISEYVIWDIHDGELIPSIENRIRLIREIREWQADIVMGHRPWDYHPDHRYAGTLVQDAAYLVGVPKIVPDTPPLKTNPLFLYTRDSFQKPYPFKPDITIDITSTFKKKIYAVDAYQSQVYEWGPWIGGFTEDVPKNSEDRLKWLMKRRTQSVTPEMKIALEKWYGKERAETIIHAEAFEICEYGKQPSDENIRQLFPMIRK